MDTNIIQAYNLVCSILLEIRKAPIHRKYKSRLITMDSLYKKFRKEKQQTIDNIIVVAKTTGLIGETRIKTDGKEIEEVFLSYRIE